MKNSHCVFEAKLGIPWWVEEILRCILWICFCWQFLLAYFLMYEDVYDLHKNLRKLIKNLNSIKISY